MTDDLTFRDATTDDVPAVVALVESAYRGDSSRTGWTTEADLLRGQRTDPAGVREVVEAPGSRLLLAEQDGVLVACCQLEHRGERGYFGMFAVRPGRQGGGLGKAVLAAAEREAQRAWGVSSMEMTVISVREELIAFYERRGYRRTGELSPFPYGDERFGIPQRDDLAFEKLVKQLPSSASSAGPRLLLATFQLMPDGEPGGAALLEAMAARGIDARWARWDDPGVDWAAADLVAVRSTWDYHRRTADFLAWARSLGDRVLNGADVFAWNVDKAYLRDLAEAGVATVPTALVDDHDLVAGLADALGRWGTVVVKPRTGAGGVGVCVVEGLDDERLEGLVAAPWVVQPLVESVRTTGETSVYVFGGEPVAQVDKRPAAGEIRVHELYGGRSRPVPLDPTYADLARAAVAAAGRLTGHAIHYARVDVLVHDGRPVVSELELVEPGLYLDVDPANAGRFADLVAGVLGLPTGAVR